MLGEHIEEVIKLVEADKKRKVTVADVDEIVESVLDIAYAQGLIPEAELDMAHVHVTAQTMYLANLS